jgi:hypothetical protein
VSLDGSGFTGTSIQSLGGAIFTSEEVTVNGLINPGAGFLPVPSLFNMAPIPSLPGGSTLTQTQDGQALQFSSKPVLGPQSVIAGMNFQYSWTEPQLTGSDIDALNLLISSAVNGPHFFAVPPAGQLPSSFGPVTTGQNGVFTFALFSQNAGVSDPAQNFGITAAYEVTGSFTLDSADGVLVAPEPSTLALTATALLALAAIRWRKRVSSL